MNNRIRLNIAGVSLVVSTPEDDSYVERIATTVNQDIRLLLEETKASVTSAALLLTIDYMDRFQKANRSATNMRTQIKGYLADAANAKLLFDEEKKRSDALAREIDEMRAKLEQLGTAVAATPAIPNREELEAMGSKLQSMNEQLYNQNDYISRQDEELKRLNTELSEHLDRVGLQSQQISALELSLQQKQGEIDRLMGELTTLEDMITDDVSYYTPKNQQQASPLAQPQRQTQSPMPMSDERPQQKADDPIALPPLYRSNPTADASYDIDDMPNLNWTDNI